MIRQGCGTSVEVSVRLKIDVNTEVPRVRSCQQQRRAPDRGVDRRVRRRSTRHRTAPASDATGRRALGSFAQAVLVLRWFLDGTRVAQLARDNQVSSSSAYRYLHEVIDVLAAVAPGVPGALLAARTAGHTHVH